MDAEGSLNLTLAMLSPKAEISGVHLYRTAFDTYAKRGAKLGWASFSASNIPVLNIYASLGARFTKAEAYWFWVNPSWNRNRGSRPLRVAG